MRRFLPWLLACCVGSALAADPCAELPKPTVTIKRIDDRIVENGRYGYRSLTTIGASANRPGRQVLGLTRGNATAAFALSLPMITDPSGRWECASPQITLTYGMSPLTVYVAREFPAGTCAYQEIHEHEMRHVQTYQAHLAAIEKELNETLTRRFATETIWHAPAGETAEHLRRELDERWLPYVQRLIQQAEIAQAEIDTPEEYERVAQSCNGEITRRLATTETATTRR